MKRRSNKLNQNRTFTSNILERLACPPLSGDASKFEFVLGNMRDFSDLECRNELTQWQDMGEEIVH